MLDHWVVFTRFLKLIGLLKFGKNEKHPNIFASKGLPSQVRMAAASMINSHNAVKEGKWYAIAIKA